MRLRVSSDLNFTPTKNKIQITNSYLHNVKQCNLNIYMLSYSMNSIQIKIDLHNVLQCFYYRSSCK